MCRIPARWIFISLLLLLPARAEGIVMLNVQWNEHREEWETRPLILEGEGLSLNRDYQNAYGYEMDLPPGPPFVITDDILIYNIVDDDYVTDWGSLSVTTTGEGTDPFVLQFNPSQGPSPGPNTGVMVRGHLSIEGTTSDPVVFAGAFSGIVNPGWYENNKNNRPRISLANCVFDRMGYDGECGSCLLSIYAADVIIENCQFSNFLPNAFTRLIKFEETSGLDPATWNFTMRECRFSNIILDGAPPIRLWGIGGEVRIEGNDFRDLIFDDSSWQDGVLVDLSPFDWGRIAGNTGGGNTNSAFYIRGYSDSEHGSMTLRSSEELPFLIGQITALDDQTLTIEEGSVLKMINNGVEANFRVYGDMIA
ncbi:MAG: hypothetical protein JXB45_02245, partial [Candidatus Krumholzibacteriota bacterium]|nr:hypothetical protein [Candidatus Krumholzibacteriota bacterium]